MSVNTMTQMWFFLQAYTFNSDGQERRVNHLNEWGGFSKRAGMPVFTGWYDLTSYDKEKKTNTALVSDSNWGSAIGVNNQEFWLRHAEENYDGIAAFFIIHAADKNASPRKVKYIDADAIFVGRIVREGTKAYIVGQRRAL